MSIKIRAPLVEMLAYIRLSERSVADSAYGDSFAGEVIKNVGHKIGAMLRQ